MHQCVSNACSKQHGQFLFKVTFLEFFVIIYFCISRQFVAETEEIRRWTQKGAGGGGME